MAKPTHEERVAYNSNEENIPYVMTEQGDIVIDSNEIVSAITREILSCNWATAAELDKAKADILDRYKTRVETKLEQLEPVIEAARSIAHKADSAEDIDWLSGKKN